MKPVNRFTAKYRLVTILSLGFLVVSCLHVTREVSQKRFMQMVKDREVQHIAIVNGNSVDVWLKPHAAASTRYNNMFSNRDPEKPHFLLRVSSEKAFRRDVAKINPRLSITSVERHGLFGI